MAHPNNIRIVASRNFAEISPNPSSKFLQSRGRKLLQPQRHQQ
jgi:hypothetical protein